jgi:U2 small nuclear ribonucleoprotein A'
MRLSADIISQSEQRSNALGEREIVLRGLAIPAIENLGATRDLFDTIDFADNRISRLENFPRLLRLSSLLLSENSIESIDVKNLKNNIPNITNLVLTGNRINGLHEIGNIADACAKLEFLTLTGNPVTSEFPLERLHLVLDCLLRYINVMQLLACCAERMFLSRLRDLNVSHSI